MIHRTYTIPARPAAAILAAALLAHGVLLGAAAEPAATAPEPVVPRAVWINNTYGAEDVVLPGFEPLEADGAVVQLWGRTYDFTDAIMPRQIVNQGKKMLARPINWFVRVNGQDIPLALEAMRQVESSPTRVRYESRGSLGPLAVTTSVMVEYDGFMKFDIQFDPGAEPVGVERLWMEIPLVPAQSRNLFHMARRNALWESNMSYPWDKPVTDHWQYHLRLHTQAITLGTADRSLQWMTESDQHYFPRGNPAALQAITQDDAHVFRTQVIGAEKEIAKPFALTFALHAGPVRARPDGWRGWTLTGRRHREPGVHRSIGYRYFTTHWSRAPGDLIPTHGYDDPRLDDAVEATSLHFGGFRAWSEKDAAKRLPEWEKYEDEWVRVDPEGGLNARISDRGAPGWAHRWVDTNSSWKQWHVYNAYQLFSRTKLRGLYYDDWYPGLSMNEAAGSGYVDEDGVRRPTWPLFSQREIHRRVYAIVRKFRPDDGLIIIHTSGAILLPIVSFCDVIYDGEILGWADFRPPNGDYWKTYRDDLLQTVFSCRNYGPVPGFHDMTGTGQWAASTPKRQRQLWWKLLSHDIHAHGGFSTGRQEMLHFYLDHGFPLTDPGVIFHPYWDESPAVKPMRCHVTKPNGASIAHPDDTLTAVAYSKPGGQALVLVAWDAPDGETESAIVEVQLDRKKLGLPKGPLTGFSLESLGRAEKGTIEGDVLKVEVEADDYSAVIVRPRKQ